MTEPTHPYQPRHQPQDKPAFVMCATGEAVTFAEIETRANQSAQLLRAQGVGIGDHIAIVMENRREFLELCFAADRCGVYYTTIGTHLTEEEIAFILGDCDARLVIASDRYLPLVQGAARASNCTLFRVGEGPQDVPDWAAAAAGMPRTPIADERQGLDMLYSSGTTGRPKGIKWPLPQDAPGGRTMLIDLLTELFGYAADTRYLSPAPLYHAAPLRHAMVTIKMGGTAYIMDRFDAKGALELIERHKVTHSQWVPTMFVRLLKLPEADRLAFDLGSMEMAVHAAAPCPHDIKRKMIDWWGPVIHEYYAGTENNGFTAITSAEWLIHPGSVGKAKLGHLHICDEAGVELPIGETGEVYFENGHQFSYHKDPAKTAACTNAQGWTTLGDIGHLDDEGYLYLTDRKSFVIISGGVNIYPQETENVLLSHPAVLDTAVIGVPNADFGEEVKAIVQLMPSVASSETLAQSLIDHCRQHLSPIKCPRSIDFKAQLPRSATGKLYKRRLREQYWNR
ncbi:AMP-dependent synthetase and ligase [Roseobacter sp. AzwK-3b]|uniref:acyl-CoA synthetase n=1 Tax=Roseobacter sp. AzwK-3b TaxID=351016 RepID=UPI0001568B01|nr:acyl-CoA synthetase [Roseobacter sp. AzwK-3b]EDM71431.1 AMP-dependent synthetase and ligase [Roseobacter sp. AzwK-3b]